MRCENYHPNCFGGFRSDRSLTQAVNNLAVALLGQGKLKEGIEVLEAALETSPSTLAMAEPFLFNLCTCFNYGWCYCAGLTITSQSYAL